MKHFMGFSYDGITSKSMGVTQVKVGDGLFEDDMMSNRTLEVETVRGRDSAYLKHVGRDMITIEMTLYIENGFDEEKLDRLRGWFDKDYYKPFFFDERGDRIVWALLESNMRLSHDGEQGYFTVTLKANSAYWHTPVVAIEYEKPGTYQLENKGVGVIYPVYELYANSNITESSPFKIRNLRTNEEMVVHEMAQGEKMTIDTMNESVASSLPNIYRYDAWNEQYLPLARGNNLLEISGDVHVVVKYRARYR